MTSYEQTLEQLLNEERQLRRLAEEQVRACNRVLSELAVTLAPGAVDARRRVEPGFPQGMSAQAWQVFLRELGLRPTPGASFSPTAGKVLVAAGW